MEQLEATKDDKLAILRQDLRVLVNSAYYASVKYKIAVKVSDAAESKAQKEQMEKLEISKDVLLAEIAEVEALPDKEEPVKVVNGQG